MAMCLFLRFWEDRFESVETASLHTTPHRIMEPITRRLGEIKFRGLEERRKRRNGKGQKTGNYEGRKGPEFGQGKENHVSFAMGRNMILIFYSILSYSNQSSPNPYLSQKARPFLALATTISDGHAKFNPKQATRWTGAITSHLLSLSDQSKSRRRWIPSSRTSTASLPAPCLKYHNDHTAGTHTNPW